MAEARVLYDSQGGLLLPWRPAIPSLNKHDNENSITIVNIYILELKEEGHSRPPYRNEPPPYIS